MTFEQAACEVLRRTGKALSPREIAVLAVKHTLLTVVGKNPAETMSARLRVATRPGNQSKLVQIRSGSYGLKDWSGTPPGTGEGFPEPVAEQSVAKTATRPKATGAPRSGSPEANTKMPEKKTRSRRKKKKPAEQKAEATETAPSADAKGSTPATATKTKARRPRRRRGGRARKSATATKENVRKTGREHPEEATLRQDQTDALVKAAYAVLKGSGSRKAEHFHRIAEMGQKQGLRATGYAIHTAILSDNQRRASHGLRPLFVPEGEGEWRLAEWTVPSGLSKLEEQLTSVTRQLRETARKEVSVRLHSLDSAAFQQLAAVLLERHGYVDISLVGRSSQGNVAFTASQRRGFSNGRTAVVLRTSGGAVSRTHVRDVRSRLDDYGAASAVILAPVGVKGDARQEAAKETETPITLLDVDDIAELCLDVNLGVVEDRVAVVRPDLAFFDSLRLR